MFKTGLFFFNISETRNEYLNATLLTLTGTEKVNISHTKASHTLLDYGVLSKHSFLRIHSRRMQSEKYIGNEFATNTSHWRKNNEIR